MQPSLRGWNRCSRRLTWSLPAEEVLAPDLAEALLRGTSIGGARPKVTLLDDTGRPVIAKLSTQSDPYPVVRFEAVAMALADRVGIRPPEFVSPAASAGTSFSWTGSTALVAAGGR